MIKRYGEKALAESAARADELALADDNDGAATWRRIMAPVTEPREQDSAQPGQLMAWCRCSGRSNPCPTRQLLSADYPLCTTCCSVVLTGVNRVVGRLSARTSLRHMSITCLKSRGRSLALKLHIRCML